MRCKISCILVSTILAAGTVLSGCSNQTDKSNKMADSLTMSLLGENATQINFTNEVDGYKVQAVIGDDDMGRGKGIFRFYNDSVDVIISTVYMPTIFFHVEDSTNFVEKEVEIDTETDSLNAWGRPFFMMDVDFDGRKEVLFPCPGYNVIEYQVYKIAPDYQLAWHMDDEPFCSFVTSDGTPAETIFDYENKTVTIEGTSGCCDCYHYVYKLKPKEYEWEDSEFELIEEVRSNNKDDY